MDVMVLFIFGSSISLALGGAVLLPCFLVKDRARCGISKNIRLDNRTQAGCATD